MEWHQTHGNYVFDVFDTIPLIPLHPPYCGKLVEGSLKHLTQVKQFKGNATKY
jgi:hypothetical protein